MRTKVLLGHLNSNGDCLLATVIARQIKEIDFPDCHLTWAVNSRCRQSVELNPLVDEIWEIPTAKSLTTQEEWDAFVGEVERRERNGDFDRVFLTQIIGENSMNYDGGIRSSTYNNYPNKIVVPHTPIIRLSETEIENVRQFAEQHELAKYQNVVLVECGPDSFDVELTPQSAYQTALELTADFPDAAFILSSNKRVESTHRNIIDGSVLTFRENAELTKYCDLLIGCASGISWLATTDWAKKLPLILIIKQENGAFPSLIYDHEFLQLPTDHIIEIKNEAGALDKVKNCFAAVQKNGFDHARIEFNEPMRLQNLFHLKWQFELQLSKLNLIKSFAIIRRNTKRNGFRLLFDREFREVIRHLQSVFVNKTLTVLGLRRIID